MFPQSQKRTCTLSTDCILPLGFSLVHPTVEFTSGDDFFVLLFSVESDSAIRNVCYSVIIFYASAENSFLISDDKLEDEILIFVSASAIGALAMISLGVK